MKEVLSAIDQLSQPVAALCLIVGEMQGMRALSLDAMEARHDAQVAAEKTAQLFVALRKTIAPEDVTFHVSSRRQARALRRAVVEAFPVEVLDIATDGDETSGVVTIYGAPLTVRHFCRGFIAGLDADDS